MEECTQGGQASGRISLSSPSPCHAGRSAGAAVVSSSPTRQGETRKQSMPTQWAAVLPAASAVSLRIPQKTKKKESPQQ